MMVNTARCLVARQNNQPARFPDRYSRLPKPSRAASLLEHFARLRDRLFRI